MNDLAFACRQLVKNPGFTLVSVVTLALGIGANTALFSIVNGVLLQPLPYSDPDQLVTLWESSPSRGIDQQPVSPPNFADWQAESSVFSAMAYWTGPSEHNLVMPDGAEKVRGTYGSSSLFGALRVTPHLGRGFLPEEDRKEGPLTAVISHQLWQERFGGDPGVLGRSLTLDTYGRRTYSIVGVMPPRFEFPDNTQVWLAAGWNGLPTDRRTGPWLSVLARLKSHVTLREAQSAMNGVQARITQAHPGLRMGSEVSVVPLLRQTVGRSVRTSLLVLWSVVAGVLLIACANLANLMLARAVSRRKEIALRLALGASRWRVTRQLLTESVLLALLGAVAGTLLAYGGIKSFQAINPGDIPRLAEVSIDGTAWGFTLGLAILTGVVFGLAPAWQCSRTNLAEAAQEAGRGGTGGVSAGRTRGALVIAEMGLATVLLVGAGLMLQSFARLMATDRGFRPGQVLVADLDFSVAGFTTWIRPTATRPQVKVRELLERIRTLPGVQSAGAAHSFFRSDSRPAIQSFSIFGRPILREGDRPTALNNAITPDYLRTLGITLQRGRDFTEADGLEAPGVAIVNESFARRFFPNEDPLGQRVTLDNSPGPLEATNVFGQSAWTEIVGVVSDVKSLSPQPDVAPEIYRPYWQWPMQNPKVFVRADVDPAALTGVLRRETRAIIPSLPVPSIRLLTERVGESMAQPRFQAGVLSLFGSLALFLAAFGTYGMLAYAVAQREREIGVRMALGAQKQDVLRLVIGHGLKLSLIGIGLGLAAALALTRVVQSLLFEVKPTDPGTFGVVAVILVGVALLACWLPARRATRIHPMEALRHD